MSGKSAVTPPQARRLHDADVVYCYDGSFEGFLCCVFESFVRHEIPFAVWPPDRETSTLYPALEIVTDPAKADRVFASLASKLGRETQRMILTDFLSGHPDKELLMLRFLHFAFAKGPAALSMTGNAVVAPIWGMWKPIRREIDKLQGFIRFEESGGMLGAVIHPQNYVLPLLRGHFCARFPEENFLIYDATHFSVLLYQNHKAEILSLAAPLSLPPADEKELYYQTLWKQFYKTLEIQARHNERCRRNNCPKRYWADMTELRDAL